MNKRAVILGNGIAGFSAAQEFRKQQPEGEIWIVSKEKEPSYRRPLLSKTYLKDLKREKIQIVEDSWYEKNHIRQILGRQIVGLEADERLVRLSDGQQIRYDACIYALGAENVLPPFCREAMAAGKTRKAGVSALRTMEDIRRIKKRLVLSEEAVVIGGGTIGLEMAWEIAQMGCKVTILEGAPWLMGRLLDQESADVLARHIEKKKIRVYTGIQVESLTGERAVTGVRLADGRYLPAGLVVVCCGIRANVRLAREAKLACDGGVLVDDFMQTDRPGIYGAGDCVRWRGTAPGLWGFAQASGRLAGYNAAVPEEKRERLAPASYPVLFSGMGISLFAMGDVQKGEGSRQRPAKGGREERFLVNHRDGAEVRYEKYFYQGGQLTGAVLLGDLSRMEEIRQALALQPAGGA